MVIFTILKQKIGKEQLVLILLLFFGLFHGLIYTFLVPPWQHNDEPSKFEFAWLIANKGYRQSTGDFDQEMRREVSASMIENGFFRSINYPTNLLLTEDPIWIGISQVKDPPLYYILASLPLRLLRYSDITLQLYSSRLISVLLYLVSIVAAWGITREITQDENPLRWMVPAFLILLPGFTDLMTAVNNDVGAVAIFSLFLWSGIYLIKYKLSIPIFISFLLLMAMAYFTKTTILVTIPLGFIILLFIILKLNKRKYAWTAIGLIFLFSPFLSIQIDNAAYWYQSGSQTVADRVYDKQAPLGKYVIQLSVSTTSTSSELYQLIPADELKPIQGSNISIGGWIWADKRTQIVIPYLSTLENNSPASQKISIGTKPAYFVFQQHLPDSFSRAWFTLTPHPLLTQGQITIYYDGLTLVKGKQPVSLPQYLDIDGKTIIWGDKLLDNFLRNGSGELAWPRLRNWIERIGQKYFPGQPSAVVASILDWQGSKGYFKISIQYLFLTFWGRFGWGNVPLILNWAYIILGIFTIIGIAGAVLSLWSRSNILSSEIIFLFIMSIALLWGPALVRGIPTLREHIFIPSARYAFPTIIPVAILLNSGWLEITRLAHKVMPIPKHVFPFLYLILFFLLDSLAIITITLTYYRR